MSTLGTSTAVRARRRLTPEPLSFEKHAEWNREFCEWGQRTPKSLQNFWTEIPGHTGTHRHTPRACVATTLLLGNSLYDIYGSRPQNKKYEVQIYNFPGAERIKTLPQTLPHSPKHRGERDRTAVHPERTRSSWEREGYAGKRVPPRNRSVPQRLDRHSATLSLPPSPEHLQP